jgi:hypothetical protein
MEWLKKLNPAELDSSIDGASGIGGSKEGPRVRLSDMKAFIPLILLSTLSTLLAGCESPILGDSARPQPPIPSEIQNRSDTSDATPRVDEYVADLASHLTGVQEQEAISRIEKAGLVWRVGSRDGESFPLTLDFNPNRITLAIEDGIVVGASTG